MVIIIVLLLLTMLWIILIAPGRENREELAKISGRNFAHRGLHSADKTVPENSLAAFELAVQHGYGMELDVRLTKDGQVIVLHDDTLDRVCGESGKASQLTFDELQKYRLCGTEERIPLFSEVLKTVDGRTPLIVELKACYNNRALCEKNGGTAR